jgi:hypothetical protein
MATNPNTLPENSGRITPPDVNYLYGSAKNDTTGTAGDGTPIKEALMNDTYGMQQALLNATSIVPSGNADTILDSEYLAAIVEEAQGRASYMIEDGTSAADAYVVIPSLKNMAPRSYFIGQTIVFPAGIVNTGPSTFAVLGLGAKNIKTAAGADPAAGDITGRTKLEYDGTNFVIIADLSTAGGGLGVGQTTTDVTGSRALATNYTNTTGRTIFVAVALTASNGVQFRAQITVDGITFGENGGYSSSGNADGSVYFPVPDGIVYQVNKVGGVITLLSWIELR